MKRESSRIDNTKSAAERVVLDANEAIRKAQLPIMDAGLRVTCTDLRELVDIRLKEARVLADAGFASGATFLASHSVALALRICFEEWVTRCATSRPSLSYEVDRNDLPILIDMAQLTKAFRCQCDADEYFKHGWNHVFTWSAKCRLSASIPLSQAIVLVDFTSDPIDGAVQWVKRYWRVAR